MIGATTLAEYRQYVEKDAALERRFQPVYVGEPSFDDTVAILRGLKEKYEIHHGVKIADDASWQPPDYPPDICPIDSCQTKQSTCLTKRPARSKCS